jgi:hypothetical protein
MPTAYKSIGGEIGAAAASQNRQLPTQVYCCVILSIALAQQLRNFVLVMASWTAENRLLVP